VVFYADNFDRGGNAELIGTGTQPWVGFPGLWITTAAGELQRVGATATVTAAVLGPCATNDQEATATILTRGGAGTVGVVCRAGTLGSGGYAGRVSSSGQWLIAGGSGTLVTETTGSYVNGDRVTLRCVGSVLTLLVNGVVKLTVTDTTIPTGSYVGVRASSAGTPPRFDLFTGGDFPPPTQSRTAVGRFGLRLAATRRVVRPRTGTVGVGARPAGRRLTVARAVAAVRLGLTPPPPPAPGSVSARPPPGWWCGSPGGCSPCSGPARPAPSAGSPGAPAPCGPASPNAASGRRPT
jgi:hypothetical protein